MSHSFSIISLLNKGIYKNMYKRLYMPPLDLEAEALYITSDIVNMD